MLVKVDRTSMAASLEVRCPLLDHKLAEWACTVPNSYKLRNGKGKYLLIRALGELAPSLAVEPPENGLRASPGGLVERTVAGTRSRSHPRAWRFSAAASSPSHSYGS